MELWTNLCGQEIPPIPARHAQKAWDLPLLTVCKTRMKEELQSEPTAEARIKAFEPKESNAWLRALPASSLGNLLDNSTFRISIGLRLGLPVTSEHRCICEANADALGHHALSCGRGGRQRRHHNLNATIARAFASAGVKTELEPEGLIPLDGRRPDGLTMEPWERGRSLAWDATCVCTLALSHLAASTSTVASAANQAERLKRRKYDEIKPNYLFCPLGFETFGPWGIEATSLLHEIGKRIRAQNEERRSTEFLRERIGIDIQRGNASCVLGTRPFSDNLDELFAAVRPPKNRN